MGLLLVQLLAALILLIILFFLSRFTTNQLFHFLRRIFKSDKTVFGIITLIFFPGTVIHELAHFFAAIVLFLPVKDLKVFPEWKDNYLKLGHVLYEKKDVVRGFLVGIAPVFVGLFVFWAIFAWQLFPNQNFMLNIIIVYLIFAVSSTMFSSKQDLVDLASIPPILIFLWGFIYVFNIKVGEILAKAGITELIISFLSQINFYLLLSIAIHVAIIIMLKFFSKLK